MCRDNINKVEFESVLTCLPKYNMDNIYFKNKVQNKANYWMTKEGYT